MIDHVGLPVKDLVRSKAFYLAALAPLGYTQFMDVGTAVGLGVNNKPDFWLHLAPAGSNPGACPVHICVSGESHALVDAAYEAAIAAGGKDNGKPGLRPQYHPQYYGAFITDPDGHNFEICNHCEVGDVQKSHAAC
ncbi:hypothetical protein HDU86_007485 [Geranomyces michiganensis]|nr:hypothetical protein HDU86_007485 [Geranomyces michiganensis]